jgi:hypothetical protein
LLLHLCCTVRIFHIVLMKNRWNLGSFVVVAPLLLSVSFSWRIFEILDLLMLHLCYCPYLSYSSHHDESLKSWIFWCCTSATVRIFHILLMKNLWNLRSFFCCTSATYYGLMHYLRVYLLIRARCTVSYIACKAAVRNGAPLLELSWYPFSKYTNFVADVNLASSLLHKSRREIRENEAWQTNRQTKPGSDKTNAHLGTVWHISSHTRTHKLITVHLRRTVTRYCLIHYEYVCMQ